MASGEQLTSCEGTQLNAGSEYMETFDLSAWDNPAATNHISNQLISPRASAQHLAENVRTYCSVGCFHTDKLEHIGCQMLWNAFAAKGWLLLLFLVYKRIQRIRQA